MQRRRIRKWIIRPLVAAVVVVARQGEGGGELRLAAYVVGAAGGAPAPEGLRRFLAERLPAAMIPAHFVELAALPLTRSKRPAVQRVLRPKAR